MLNKAMVIGHLGADPEMRYTANGNAVTTFNVATSRQFQGPDGERREETEWFRVVTWNRLAETCSQYLSKGRLVYVEGRMQTRSWEGQDGQKRYTTELIAQEVKFLGGRDGGGGGGGGGRYSAGLPVGADAEGDIEPDDLPF
ncbi:MAG: single-stranded DNA-binding protein [Dehalococcoidia bacterium]|nr:single-stranded DNA-binding protein [Dehalococcoidia bacterium]